MLQKVKVLKTNLLTFILFLYGCGCTNCIFYSAFSKSVFETFFTIHIVIFLSIQLFLTTKYLNGDFLSMIRRVYVSSNVCILLKNNFLFIV